MATLLQNNMDTQFNEQKEDGRLYPGRTTPEVETASFSCMFSVPQQKENPRRQRVPCLQTNDHLL